MDVVDLPLEQIIPYARNPRRNEQAIATVAASIQELDLHRFRSGLLRAILAIKEIGYGSDTQRRV